MEMLFCPLYSGSSGNALFVQYGQTRLLIDAGKTGKCIFEALDQIGVDPKTLSGILVTHEHSDHVSGVGVLCRKLKIPVYATEGTWRGMEKRVGKIAPEFRVAFDKTEDFYIGQIGVTSFAIPHDAADPVGYRLWGGDVSISTATDLGHFTRIVHDHVAGSGLVLLESNHDPEMLRLNDRYSSHLKQRILGRHGHLSNDACAEALVELVNTGVTNVILGHLSGENNTPDLALRTSENRVELEGIRLGHDLHLDIARRDEIGSVYHLGSAV